MLNSRRRQPRLGAAGQQFPQRRQRLALSSRVARARASPCEHGTGDLPCQSHQAATALSALLLCPPAPDARAGGSDVLLCRSGARRYASLPGWAAAGCSAASAELAVTQ